MLSSEQMRLRTAALFAAIGLTLARLQWTIYTIWALTQDPNLRHDLIPTVTSLLFLIPLPVVLFILFKTDAPLDLSNGLRWFALIVALVQGLVFTVPRLYGLVWALFENGVTPASTAGLIGATIIVISQVTFVVFMAVLFFYKKPDGDSRQSSVLREAAALATIIGGLAVLLNLGQQIYAATRTSLIHPDYQRIALGALPEACWAAAAYIIYKAQPSKPVAANDDIAVESAEGDYLRT